MGKSLWIYKCNLSHPESEGNWQEFFEEKARIKRWGNTRDHIRSASSRRYINDRMKPGDWILAWQTDKRAAVGMCELVDLKKSPGVTTLVLRKLMQFEPIKFLELKKKSKALAGGKGFQKGQSGTIAETTAKEAAEILRVCKAACR